MSKIFALFAILFFVGVGLAHAQTRPFSLGRTQLCPGSSPTCQPGFVQPAAACSGTWTTNVAFRATNTFVTDGTKTSYDLGTSSYPHSTATNGGTVPDATSIGWTASTVGVINERDRNASLDARLAGLHFGNSATTSPNYDVLLGCQKHCSFAFAAGDPSSSNFAQVVVHDGAGGSTLATIPGSSATVNSGNYLAADGNVYADSTLTGLSQTVSLTFTGTIAEVQITAQATGVAPLQWISLVCTP